MSSRFISLFAILGSSVVTAASLLVVLLIGFPAPATGMPESLRIPMLQEREKGDPPEEALFSHWGHAQYRCYECHPSVFPERKKGFTHDDMKQGKYCGACHNDRIAWSPENDRVECEACHVGAPREEELDFDDLFGDMGDDEESGTEESDTEATGDEETPDSDTDAGADGEADTTEPTADTPADKTANDEE